MSLGPVRPEDLAAANGQNGNPAWVAVDGVVYDVSASRMWKQGTHVGRHRAGADLSVELAAAPHGTEVLSRPHVRAVGRLERDGMELPGPRWVRRLLHRFPSLQRHPHPMLVHFPIAYSAAASLFAAAWLLGWAPWLTLRLALAMLGLALVFTPPAVATGFFAWWLIYRRRMVHHVRCKIVCSSLLLGVEATAAGLWVGGAATHGWGRLVFSGLLLSLLPLAALLGHHGGELTFPTPKTRQRDLAGRTT